MMKETAQNHDIDALCASIRTRILQGTLLPGTKLSENNLAKEAGCSRTPVREALKRLEQDGFVVILPHSGSYVKSCSLKEYQEITEIRSYLEGLSFRLAVERNADTTEIAKILSEMDELVNKPPFDLVAFGEKHYRFHQKLVEMSGNPLLLQTFNRLNLNANSLLFYQKSTKESFAITQAEHHKILTALEEGDAKVEKFVIMHLWKKRDNFKREAEQTSEED